MKPDYKAAVLILLGQSNAVGHGLPMDEQDKISVPLKNVFGLHRRDNQSFSNKRLTWSGYTSAGMNLAEEQDHTYSVVNCLAKQWQDHIDSGNLLLLPDLYIIQIAIGAQGVTEKYLWYPEREEQMKPGRTGDCRISLFPFSRHIFSLVDDSFKEMGKGYEIIGIHWRGGENDMCEDEAMLRSDLLPIYRTLLDGFNDLLDSPPTYLHRVICGDRADDLDPSGQMRKNMVYVNQVFETLEGEYENVFMFEPSEAPQYVPNVRGNGVFGNDAVHFTREVNEWVAECIIKHFVESHTDSLP